MRIGLFGLPGAGKGTQAVLLSERLSIPHISTGDMFRELEKGDSPVAREIKAILASGKLVPDDLVTKMTFDRLERPDCAGGYILDGFPRTLPQAVALQNCAYALDGLIAIDVDKDEIIKRLSSRRVCERCRSVFSQDALSGASTCPHDGGRLVQRPDDLPEAISTRLLVFERNFQPVIGFYEEIGQLYRVDGNGSPEAVFSRLSEVIATTINRRGK